MTVLLIVAALVLGWLVGIYMVMWVMRRGHPVAYYALCLSIAKKKGKREGEQ